MASALSSPPSARLILDRRSTVAAAASAAFLLAADPAAASLEATPPPGPSALPSGIVAPNPRAVVAVPIGSSRQSAGLELRQARIGTPPRPVVAINSVRPGGLAARAGAQPGMILLDYARVEDVLRRLSDGPYPAELRLYNLAMGGDAVGDLGRSIVAPEDALELAERVSGGSVGNVAALDGKNGQTGGLEIKTIKNASGECAMKSRRGDTLQVRYDAMVGDRNGVVYDSSSSRGTGQPYAYQLGNGDVLAGVDLGTYDMCPGEVRELSIPPELGYRGGSRLYPQIPPNSPLFWRVKLVELNFVREGENVTPREELEERY